MEDSLIKQLESEGYFNLHETKNYGIVGLFRFMFTTGLVVGLDPVGYNRRYCYPTIEHAKIGLQLLLEEDKKEYPLFDPPDPFWIKRKGYPYEISNPYHDEQRKRETNQ